MSLLNPSEPLWLPNGSVRAILALLVVVSTILFNGIRIIQGDVPDATTVGLAGMVLGYYFAKRDGDAAADLPLQEPLVDED